MKRKPAFDVVIDGLNVANVNKDKTKQSETVRSQAQMYKQSLSQAPADRQSLFRISLHASLHMSVQPRGFFTTYTMTNTTVCVWEVCFKTGQIPDFTNTSPACLPTSVWVCMETVYLHKSHAASLRCQVAASTKESTSRPNPFP